jgi:hypothetical protein
VAWHLSLQSFKDVGLVSVVQYKVAHMVDTTNNNIQLLFGTKQFPKGYVKEDINIYIYIYIFEELLPDFWRIQLTTS